MSSTSRVLVSGASGPIGAALLPQLQNNGYEVFQLVRGGNAGENQISWDPLQPIPPTQVSGFDAVIHLAGEPVVGRWTAAKKKRIWDSRTLGTHHLAEALAAAAHPPRTMVTASAVGFYGNRGDELLTEESPAGQGFAADLARAWESAASAADTAGIRVVRTRIGVVISPKGGALQKMLPAFRMGVGGNLGHGRQWMAWVDAQDVAGGILHILKNESLRGPVNVVAPNPVTNAEFTKTLGSVLHRPTIFPVPAFAARLAFGQMADELLLASQRVEPTKLMQSGYQFQHSHLHGALGKILRR